MIGALDIVLSVVPAILGALFAFSAYRSLGMYRRLRRVPTRAISELSEGTMELEATLRAADEPLRTVDGQAAVVMRTQISYTYDKDGEGYNDPWALDRMEAVRVEADDGTGKCILDMSTALILGPKVERSFRGADFVAHFPKLWAACGNQKGIKLDIVTVTQTFVPDGVKGFVSGEAARGDSLVPGEGYRDSRRRFRLRGDDNHLLLVSAWGEAALARHLRRPALVLGWVSALFFLVAPWPIVFGRAIGAMIAPH
jgi:hypothetical protein